jgi:D-alanyl-D-alanine carboxypeptidase (penicillin-binding protein 5/6)
LALGEKLKLSDLMYPLLMESSNDGAEVIADEYGHPEFLQMMNKTAALLGMKNTYYEDPSGLNPKNVSTVGDQFKLAKYIYEKYPSIFDTTLVKIFKVGNHTWTNRNAILLNISTFIGGKNGFIDEAKQTTVSLFNISMLKGGQRVVAVIELKSPDKTTDAKKLLNFVTKNVTYSPIEIQEVGIK